MHPNHLPILPFPARRGVKPRSAVLFLAFAGITLLAPDSPSAPASPADPNKVASAHRAPEVVDIIIRFTARDDTPLEAKLSLPADADGPVPVVYHLHGAGPRNYDNPVAQYKDRDGQLRLYNYYDFYSLELARRGLAFFRMSKRGCAFESSGKPLIDRSIFSKATPTLLLEDYAKGLEVLRERKEIDPNRIVLAASSEGTTLAPRLARQSPTGIIGLALMSYAADNQHDTLVWQNTVGPWRNIQKLIPAAEDGSLTKAEYEAAVKTDPSIAPRLPFEAVDPDKDGIVTAEDMERLVRPRLEALLKAVQDRNDDLIWHALLNLSSAYLQEGWDGDPNHVTLLKLDIPIAIFHGELDGTTRVEGVHETEAAFRAAGKTNLTVHLYPGHDHDLNWTIQTAADGGPKPFQDAFAWIASLVRPR